jgi:hypothetical protein
MVGAMQQDMDITDSLIGQTELFFLIEYQHERGTE